MHLSCDVTLKSQDGQVFEWVLFIRAASYSEAASFVERLISERWGPSASLQGLFLSPDENSREKQASGDDETPGVHDSREPRQMVKVGPSGMARLAGWLSGERKNR